MKVAFDTTFLLYLFNDPGTVAPPLDPATDAPVTCAEDRVYGLLEELQGTNTRIIVATPALSEIMVRAGVQAGQEYIARMNRLKVFKIEPFDIKAAIETAIMHGHAVSGERDRMATAGTHAKLKYDRQIVAIAKSAGARVLYTDDRNQRSFAERHGMKACGLAELPVPSKTHQPDLFEPVSDSQDED